MIRGGIKLKKGQLPKTKKHGQGKKQEGLDGPNRVPDSVNPSKTREHRNETLEAGGTEETPEGLKREGAPKLTQQRRDEEKQARPTFSRRGQPIPKGPKT